LVVVVVVVAGRGMEGEEDKLISKGGMEGDGGEGRGRRTPVKSSLWEKDFLLNRSFFFLLRSESIVSSLRSTWNEN